MSLFCDTGGDYDGADWWWYQPKDEAPLATKRSRKCCSCREKIAVGATARKITRYRPATEWEDMRGLGDEVQLSDWYLCETCGDIADSLSELGFCYTLGDGESLKAQIYEYRKEEDSHKSHMAKQNMA